MRPAPGAAAPRRRGRTHMAMLAAACALVAAAPPGERPHATAAGRGGRKLALLVGVGSYPPASGWSRLASARDLELLRAALLRQGFAPAAIAELADARATRAGIVGALGRLIARARPGDVAVFHFSGHGHRITDDDHDELDGYDEVLVPFDAPRQAPTGYRGERHLRDDDLGDLLRRLRAAVGPAGDVLVSLDSCYSGTAARGAARSRGAEEPLGAPQPRAAAVPAGGEEPGGGFVEGRAPYVVLSAARQFERAVEAEDAARRPVGSLSLALGGALLQAGERTTYRALFDEVKRRMAVAGVPNRPQAEGDLDREILGGRGVAQQPFFEVASRDPASGLLRLGGGTLLGLWPGTRLEIHRAGSRDASGPAPLARGEVVRASELNAYVEVRDVAPGADPLRGWAFVTEPSFGELRLVVDLGEPAGWRNALARELARHRFIEVAAESADVVVRQEGRGVVARAALDGALLAGPLDRALPDLAAIVAGRIRDFARNRYLRRLELRAPGLDAGLEILPCRLRCEEDEPAGERRCERLEDLPVARFLTRGGQLELPVGAGFRLRLINRGEQRMHVSVLDLLPDGRIHLLWPPFEQGAEDNVLERGRELVVEPPFEVEPPVGLEVIKLMASRDPLDLRPVTTDGAGSARGPSRGPLDELFLDALSGARSRPTYPRSAVTTATLAVGVIPRRQD